jgi:large subunit ribosomal protein L41
MITNLCRPIGLVAASRPSLPISSNNIQVASFSKYISKSRTKRLPLTTKRAGKGYNKGNRARKEGRVNSRGRFIPDPEKRTELVVPDLTGFKLKAYVGPGAKKNVRAVDPLAA